MSASSSSENEFDTSRLTNLERDIGEISGKLTGCLLNIKIMSKRITELTNENYELYDRLFMHETSINDLDQYSRRNNVEFKNIPESIGQKKLEDYVIKVLDSVGVKVCSYDIVAVHRLGKPKDNLIRNVIVRFMNRKNAYSSLFYRKYLLDIADYRNIFITENLCPANKLIFNHLYKLKKELKIKSVWTYSGCVYFKMTADIKEKPIKIKHIDEIEDYVEE